MSRPISIVEIRNSWAAVDHARRRRDAEIHQTRADRQYQVALEEADDLARVYDRGADQRPEY